MNKFCLEKRYIKPWPGSQYIPRLQNLLRLTNNASLFIFLGAGLSYDAGRRHPDVADEQVRPELNDFEYNEDDHRQRFPSWPMLISRMKQSLASHPLVSPNRDSLDEFFKKQGPLDCAELFHHYREGPNYWEFLKEQYFVDRRKEYITASHRKIADLSLKEIFTTNFDELIEAAYQEKGHSYRVIESPNAFINYGGGSGSDKLIIKLHGTIDRPQSIILTRTDYAKSRKERQEMYAYLYRRFQNASFLFIGFSLTDPNINVLLDDARYARDNQIPVSYVVQGSGNPIIDSYLDRRGVNPITLNSWGELPLFLSAIDPQTPLCRECFPNLF